ncbi:putative ribosomally synthesized peptide with SipW-like signal peptide [Halorubrum alkaliphilum]|uniref:Putative ribosomally synthesized peptide with SipW-like signal peptide n=1 Tax=Halorubrum alkaliphilum TaxID=261290 RepID=A0A8T4GE76_9EURY|nr:vWA domain-containing protein [Halorubrum alkaliphilum]MBP1922047.1 putative ribosomally synthesized peptide with SipW-like signal peptide [Halorubrum alkaliphilum]
MTDDNTNNFDLSRRKLLGGLGAIGVASAGAGLGTTAFFSDEESFTDNTITAGAVELRMDWQQSYYTGIDGQEPDDHTTWEPINAYPDLDGDNLQDPIYTRFQLQDDPTLVGLPVDASDEEIEAGYRGQFASFDGTETDGTGNHEFVGPVIDLDDVKPGDKGEITISKHVFDNPAYLWVNASNYQHTVGGLNDPKREALQEIYGDDLSDQELIDAADAEMQFAKEIDATLWYDDDCDNFFDEGAGACIQLVVDNTDSMGSQAPGSTDELKDELLIEALEEYVGRLDTKDGAESSDGDTSPFSVGLTNWTTETDTVLLPTSDVDDIIGNDGGSYDDSTGLQTINYQSLDGGTDLPLAIEAGADALSNCPEDEDRIMVLVTNGINVDPGDFLAPASANLRQNGGEVDRYLVIGFGVLGDDINTLEQISTLPGNHKFMLVPDPDIDQAINGPADPNTDPVTSVAEEIGFTAGGEQAIFQGSLYDLLTEGADITDDGFVDDYEVDGIAGGYPLDSDRNRDGRQCYPNSDTRCIALEWHLPFEVGNEIQGDSIVFNLDFYAEQCRHNEGSHNPFEEPQQPA